MSKVSSGSLRLSGNAFQTDGLATNKPGSRTSSDGIVERSVSVEQQIAGADDQ